MHEIAGDLDRWIDRLVDNELDPDSYRLLLERLDAEPDAWRRCALAFLEARDWRAALRAGDVVAIVRHHSTPRSPRSWRADLLRFGGTAAVLMLAFCLGWVVHGGIPRRAVTTPVLLTNVSPKVETRQAAAGASASGSPVVEPRPGAPRPFEHRPRPVAASLSDPLLEGLREEGFRVEAQQQLLTTEYLDGEPMVVPVEAIRIRYIGDRTY